MLFKCCTQYVSKFEKSSSGHRTGKGQSLSQFPRRTILKTVQATRQLHLSPMLVRLCSKSSKLGLSSIWTKNFQMFKWGLEESELYLQSDHKQDWERRTTRLFIVILFTYMQSTSCKILGWICYKLKSRFPGEISTTTDTHMIQIYWQKVKRN